MIVNRSASRKKTAFIASILKGTLLAQPPGSSFRFEGFFPGGRHAFHSGVAPLKWWHTGARRKFEIALARLVIAEENLGSVNLEDCRKTISNLLKETCLSCPPFRPESVLSGAVPSLFECLVVPIEEFGARFYHYLVEELKRTIMSHLTVRPLTPSLWGVSFSVDCLGVSLISGGEPLAWSQHVSIRHRGADWDYGQRAFKGAEFAFASEEFDYLAVGIESGTADWCRDRSDMNFRMLLSVVVSHFFVRRCLSLQAVMAPPPCSWIQFPESNGVAGASSSASEPLLPRFADKIEIRVDDAAAVQEWFEHHQEKPPDLRSRAEKCAFYVNLAMNNRGMYRFVLYYIALDALFGKRGSVESSIGAGVKAAVPELADRFNSISDLRNEVVHGGSRMLKEWSRYDRYTDHFGSLPERDIEAIAIKCLNRCIGAQTRA